MQHLCSDSRRHSRISAGFQTCQGQVRFFALHRIKPHTPPLVRAPVNSFEFFLRPYSPGGELNALASTLISELRPTSSSHRLGRGLPGYLILFAPHAFVPQRQCCPRWPPSPLMFLPISTHFTATPGIPPSSDTLELASIHCHSQVEPGAFTTDLTNRLRTLYAQ